MKKNKVSYIAYTYRDLSKKYGFHQDCVTKCAVGINRTIQRKYKAYYLEDINNAPKFINTQTDQIT